MKDIIKYFDKFEDRVRGRLSRYPIVYTFVGGITIVLFWRAVWNIADALEERGGLVGTLFYEPVNMLLVIAVLLATGLFVSYFIGDTILMSGLRKEKKLYEKTEKEVKESEATLNEIRGSIMEIKKELDEIKDVVEKTGKV